MTADSRSYAKTSDLLSAVERIRRMMDMEVRAFEQRCLRDAPFRRAVDVGCALFTEAADAEQERDSALKRVAGLEFLERNLRQNIREREDFYISERRILEAAATRALNILESEGSASAWLDFVGEEGADTDWTETVDSLRRALHLSISGATLGSDQPASPPSGQ